MAGSLQDTLQEIFKPNPLRYEKEQEVKGGLQAYVNHDILTQSVLNDLCEDIDSHPQFKDDWMLELTADVFQQTPEIRFLLTNTLANYSRSIKIDPRYYGSLTHKTQFFSQRLSKHNPEKARREKIRQIFLGSGFPIPPDQDDLKDYVYAAAEKLITAAKGGDFDLE